LVPLVVTVPDEATSLFQYLTFAKPLDTEARNLRDEAIRRLALGQDAPPELLLGTAGMNHWGAWLVREDVVNTHIEPPLGLICDALTTQYLWPVLKEQGMSAEEAEQYVVWYDVSHMVMRPNRLADAVTLYGLDVISDAALRDAGGFGEQDAPATLDRPVEIAIELAMKNPGLIDNMAAIIQAFKEVLSPSVAADLPEDAGVALDNVEEVSGEEETDAGQDEAKPPPTNIASRRVPGFNPGAGAGTPNDDNARPKEMR
jgi:hypothetical protein